MRCAKGHSVLGWGGQARVSRGACVCVVFEAFLGFLFPFGYSLVTSNGRLVPVAECMLLLLLGGFLLVLFLYLVLGCIASGCTIALGQSQGRRR
jgi:hypothetical protein